MAIEIKYFSASKLVKLVYVKLGYVLFIKYVKMGFQILLVGFEKKIGWELGFCLKYNWELGFEPPPLHNPHIKPAADHYVDSTGTKHDGIPIMTIHLLLLQTC